MMKARNGARARAARGAIVVVAAGVAAAMSAAGCLQILGDEGPFVQGTGGGGVGGSGGDGGMGGTGGAGICTPEETGACYSGSEGTEGIGNCKAGTQTCANDGQSWGPCEGEVTPTVDNPKLTGDEACDGYATGESIWSTLFGTSGAQRGFWVSASPVAGETYITGTFTSSFTLGSTQLDLVGSETGFAAKLDPNGTPMWAKPIPGIAPLVPPLVSATPDGGAIVTARLDTATDLGKGPVGPGSVVVKIAANGQVEWSKSCGGGPSTMLLWTAVRGEDTVLWASFDATMDCGDQPQTAVGPADLFLAKLNTSTGDVIWTRRFGEGNDHDAGNVALDQTGNILVVGRFEGPAFTNFGNGGVSDSDGSGSFVAKVDTDGSTQWVYDIIGTGDQNAFFLNVDPTGSATVSGVFDTEVLLPQGKMLSGDSLNKNLFVLRVNAGGGNGWSTAFGAALNALQAPSVGVTSTGEAILSGSFAGGALDLGGGPLVASANLEGYVARLSSVDGSHVWSRTFGNVGASSISAVSSEDEVVVTGAAAGQVDFGNGPLVTSSVDVFVAKLAP